jgi:hypothetical protein
VLAVADYIDGNTDEAPPALTHYLHTRDWGDPWGRGWMRWPARDFLVTRFVRNVYRSYSDYKKAANPSEWLNKNRGAAEVIGLIRSYQFERDDEDAEPETGPLARVERWELWLTSESATS